MCVCVCSSNEHKSLTRRERILCAHCVTRWLLTASVKISPEERRAFAKLITSRRDSGKLRQVSADTAIVPFRAISATAGVATSISIHGYPRRGARGARSSPKWDSRKPFSISPPRNRLHRARLKTVFPRAAAVCKMSHTPSLPPSLPPAPRRRRARFQKRSFNSSLCM